MRTRWCIAWLLVAGGATGADAAETGTKAADPRARAVIDDVEKACLDRNVCMIGRKKAERLAELVREAKPKLVVESVNGRVSNSVSLAYS